MNPVGETTGITPISQVSGPPRAGLGMLGSAVIPAEKPDSSEAEIREYAFVPLVATMVRRLPILFSAHQPVVGVRHASTGKCRHRDHYATRGMRAYAFGQTATDASAHASSIACCRIHRRLVKPSEPRIANLYRVQARPGITDCTHMSSTCVDHGEN